MSAVPRSIQSLVVRQVGHVAVHVGAVKLRVGHVHRYRPRVKEYRPQLELAPIAHGKPYAILELLIRNREAQSFNVRAQQDLDGLRNVETELAVHQDGLEFGSIRSEEHTSELQSR